jgi:hypothetical protein
VVLVVELALVFAEVVEVVLAPVPVVVVAAAVVVVVAAPTTLGESFLPHALTSRAPAARGTRTNEGRRR